MVAGHGVFLASFLVEADPQTAVLPVNVFHSHAERRANAGEGKNEKADQLPVAQADDGLGVAAVEQLARFCSGQHRGLAGADDIFGPAHRGGRVYGENLADHQPVEQHAHGGQPLLDGRRRKPASEALDPGGDVHWFYVEQTGSRPGRTSRKIPKPPSSRLCACSGCGCWR
jgi:hypothetical protein